MDCSLYQAPLSMEFVRQEYWSGLPFPPPGDLPHLGTESTSIGPPALAGGFFIIKLPPGTEATHLEGSDDWLFS